jgi:glycyl-tRNA synthetase beta chain
LIPSGSYDPLGLRRAGNGIIRILDKHNLPIQLAHLIDRSLASFVEIAKKNIDSTKSDIVLFFKQRIRSYLENYGIDYDVIDSVMSIDFSDVTDLKQRALDLQKFKQRKDFIKLVLGFKRVSNIISGGEETGEVKPELLEEQAEKNLFNKYITLSRVIKRCLEKKEYEKVMENLVEYGSHIDNFFDKVLVNVEDKIFFRWRTFPK